MILARGAEGRGLAIVWNVVPAPIDLTNERLWDWREPPFLYVLPGS